MIATNIRKLKNILLGKSVFTSSLIIESLKILQEQRKLHHKVLFPSLNPDDEEKSTCGIDQLTSGDLSSSKPFSVFEIIDVTFQERKKFFIQIKILKP